MTFDIMIPQMGKEKNLKDIIITILLREWPLTAKKIYNRVGKDYNLPVTYQAVYKVISNFADSGILSKKDMEYSLSPEWIQNLGDFVEKIKNAYSSGLKPDIFGLKEFKQEGEIQTFIFNSLGKAEDYRKNLQLEFLKRYSDKGGEIPPYCGQSKHLKSPVVYSEKSLNLLKTVNENGVKAYLMVAGNSPIDRWCADMYRKGGVNVKTGIKCAEKCDTMIIGEYITQMYIPDEIAQLIEKYYSSSDISKINLPEFNDSVYNRKIPIKFVMINNPEIAEQLRKQTLSFFNEK